MVKWVMVGHDALTAAEAEVPEAQRVDATKDAWDGQDQRFQDIQQYLQRDGHGEISAQWRKLAEVAPAILDGYITMRENFVKPDPLGAVRHTQRYIADGGTVPELVEAVSLAMIEDGVQCYKACGLDVIEAAESA